MMNTQKNKEKQPSRKNKRCQEKSNSTKNAKNTKPLEITKIGKDVHQETQNIHA